LPSVSWHFSLALVVYPFCPATKIMGVKLNAWGM